MVVEGNTVLVSVYSYFLMFGFQFDGQEGNVMSINVSNPAAPTLNTVLFSSSDANASTTQFGVTIVNSQIAYVASSTNSGGSTQDGEGRVLVVNYSNPTDFTYSEVYIPGTYQILTVAVEGDQALVVGRTGGDASDDNNGTMTFSVLDITNPANPTVVGTTLVQPGPIFATSAVTKISATPLGNGLFAVSEATVNGKPGFAGGGPRRSQQHPGGLHPRDLAGERDGRFGQPAVHQQRPGPGDLHDWLGREHSPDRVGGSAQQHGRGDRGGVVQHAAHVRSRRARPSTRSSGRKTGRSAIRYSPSPGRRR